jgi:hypothetical protein
MTPERRKEKLDLVAHKLLEISQELNSVLSELPLSNDQVVVRSIITDLIWATEHCTTIGLHQINLALDDKCGAR